MRISKSSMGWQKIKAEIALANFYQTLMAMTNSNLHCKFDGGFLVRNVFVKAECGKCVSG